MDNPKEQPRVSDTMNGLVRRLKKFIPRKYSKLEWTLKEQTHQGANDSRYPDINIWVRDDDFLETVFHLGDLCTWNFESDGWRLMVWSPNTTEQPRLKASAGSAGSGGVARCPHCDSDVQIRDGVLWPHLQHDRGLNAVCPGSNMTLTKQTMSNRSQIVSRRSE